jgi:hypothetical protein
VFNNNKKMGKNPEEIYSSREMPSLCGCWRKSNEWKDALDSEIFKGLPVGYIPSSIKVCYKGRTHAIFHIKIEGPGPEHCIDLPLLEDEKLTQSRYCFKHRRFEARYYKEKEEAELNSPIIWVESC